MTIIHQPNDKLFKAAFGKKLVTKDFLLSRLPADILDKIDIETLKRENNSFVDEKLKAYYSDIVFKVKTQEGEGYLFLLLEHQTNPDELMPLRLLEYDLAIMRYDVEQQQKTKKEARGPITLPVIYNFVIYSGKEDWKYPRRLIDAFRSPSLLYRMFEDEYCVCLNQEKQEKIMSDGNAALAELLLREGHRKDFCKFLSMHPKIAELMNESTYTKSTTMYILSKDSHDVDVVLEKLVNLEANKKADIMTALQKIRQEGMEKGMEKGKIEIAKQMLSERLDKSLIAKVTGLSAKEVEALAFSL